MQNFMEHQSTRDFCQDLIWQTKQLEYCWGSGKSKLQLMVMLKQCIMKSKWQEIRDPFCSSFESSSIWGISSPSSNFILQKSNVVLCCHFKSLLGYHFIICFTIFYYIRSEYVSASKWVKLMNYKINYIELPVLTLNKSKSTCISKKNVIFYTNIKMSSNWLCDWFNHQRLQICFLFPAIQKIPAKHLCLSNLLVQNKFLVLKWALLI